MRAIFPNQIALGTFKIIKRFNTGGQGLCYEADYIDCPVMKPWLKTVFVKQYHDLSPDRQTFDKIAHFFQLFKNKLSDVENFVCLPFYIGIDHNSIIAVYPWIKGNRLSDRFGSSLKHSEKVRIAFGLINAIRKLHDVQIAHLDLKPENIVVYNDEKNASKIYIQIIDLDASLIEGKGIREKGMYTPEWASPEQCFQDNFDKISIKSDIFTLGRILLILLTNVDPFPTMSKYLEDINDNNYYIPSNEYNKEIIEILSRCLNANPDHRPTANKILHTFNNYYDTELRASDNYSQWVFGKPSKWLVHIKLLDLKSDKKPYTFTRVYYNDVTLSENEMRGSGLTQNDKYLLKINFNDSGISITILSTKDVIYIDGVKLHPNKTYWIKTIQSIFINNSIFQFEPKSN